MNNAVQFVLCLLAVVVFGALEDLTPKFLCVGCPFLLATVQYLALQRSAVVALFFAAAAGGMEDALSALPLMTSASFFIAVAAFVKWVGLPRIAAVLAYPLYQAWICLWLPNCGGGVFTRVLLALPMGVITVAAVWAFLGWLDRKVGVDDEG